MRQISLSRYSNFNNDHFLQYIFDATLPKVVHSVPSMAVTITMLSCSQVLHRYVKKCPCCRRDFGEYEGLRLKILQHLNEIVPHTGDPQSHHNKMRYLFEQLRSSFQTIDQPVEQVTQFLKEEQLVKRAAKFIVRSLNVTSGTVIIPTQLAVGHGRTC